MGKTIIEVIMKYLSLSMVRVIFDNVLTPREKELKGKVRDDLFVIKDYSKPISKFHPNIQGKILVKGFDKETTMELFKAIVKEKISGKNNLSWEEDDNIEEDEV